MKATSKADYSQMTDEEFEVILRDIAYDLGTEWLLGLPMVYNIVAEELNNDVLEQWAEENPEKAFPEEKNESEED